MANLSDYNIVNGLPVPPQYTNTVVLAANVPESFTVPADQSGIQAKFVKFSKSTATAVDFFAKAFTANESADPVTNGAFATDTDWTKGAGWTIAAGVATATGAISTSLSQTAAYQLIEGRSYYVTYTATRSAGTVTINIGGTAGSARSSSATFSEIIVAGATQTIEFTTSGFTGTVDALTVIPCASVGADTTSGQASDLNPEGYVMKDIARISVISAGTPTIAANFYK
jgi:hypothetical protein